MKIAIIGQGAIGRYVREKLVERGHEIVALIVRPERLPERPVDSSGMLYVSSVDDLPEDIEHVIDCAGHEALAKFGRDILRRGIDVTTVSIGALADSDVYYDLELGAAEGHSRLILASGAIGALDCLRSARVGKLQEVTYVGRKPPQGWKGSPADEKLDLDNLPPGEHVHFDGTARDAAMQYPKNANVAAAVALAGLGFDDTRVLLIADPEASGNIHQVRASGEFGSFSFEILGRTLPNNPRSSALAAMSVVARIEQETDGVVF